MKTSTEFFTSKDYDLFNFIFFNRTPDKVHIQKLVESMKKYGFISSLVVVKTSILEGIEKFYVADGQHRFLAAQELGIEIKCQIFEFKTTDELAEFISVLNNSSKGWTTNNFLNINSALGKKEYMKLGETFNDTGIQITPLLKAYSVTTKEFRSGKMKFLNESQGDTIVAQIMDLNKILSKFAFTRRAIVEVMKDDRYDHEAMKVLIKRRSLQRGFSESETELKGELFHLLNIASMRMVS